MLRTRRGSLFAVLVAGCVLAAVATIALGLHARGSSEAASAGASDALPSARAAKRPTVVFRSIAHHGQVAIAAADRPTASPTLSALHCDRVYFAAGRGLCLARGGFPVKSRAEVFGPDLRVRHTVDVTGIASRARVSPDGRYGAVTLFVTGHAYDPGSFSTQTTIIDLASGQKIADLERFTVLRGNRQVTAIDVNFWGVTFARNSDLFYATLATGGKTYLIRGSISRRQARVIHENVECPSLSPDGTQDRLQEAHRVQGLAVAADRARPRHHARDPAQRAAIRRRPGRVARRRARALRGRRRRVDGACRRDRAAAAIPRPGGLARRRALVIARTRECVSRPSASTPSAPPGP